MSRTVNNKKLNNYWGRLRDTDSSGNLLKEGDLVLYKSEARFSTVAIKQVQKLFIDQDGTDFLGFKMSNGQYTTLNCSVYKVTDDFAELHKGLLA